MTLFINGKTYEAGELITYVENLEKENTELKAFKEKCKFNVSDICKEIETENNLTKAKEILKMVLDWQYRCGNGHPTWQEVCAKIEQFLNGDCCPDCFCEDYTKEDCGIKKLGLVEAEK